MITLKTLKWSHPFSYGSDNVIYLDKDPITQLVGKNGHGKSSIALILEEVLFNKNSKGIKKADILNRYGKAKNYSIELTFDKDGDEYRVQTSRGSTQTVTLTKNEENISAHTATATFKLLEETLGFDHKTFAQLVYQSNSSSLEFLTATDTNRKKFLIDLLNLTKYVEAFEIFKAASKSLSEEVAIISAKAATTQSWLDKNLKEDLNTQEEWELPESASLDEEQKAELQGQLTSIDSTNKKINQNNTYKAELDKIDISVLSTPIPAVESTTDYHSKLGAHKKTVTDSTALITKIEKLDGICPTCLQVVNKEVLHEIITDQEFLIHEANNAITILNFKIDEITQINKQVAKITKNKTDWETYHNLVDPELPSETLDRESIQHSIDTLTANILNAKHKLDTAIKHNNKVSAHNSKVKVILEQMDSMKAELKSYSDDLTILSERLALLVILQKTFSTNGLLAYKIECLVKDLEDLANYYLADLSSGRFQLTFKVSTGDKLNVIITDNGKDIEIFALSGGERARVNTATLLAIRKLMQSLSNARINLLILDETIDTLDGDGKEKLVEVLLKEEHLNTFLISHGFTHPLLEKITVVKDNNISRLE